MRTTTKRLAVGGLLMCGLAAACSDSSGGGAAGTAASAPGRGAVGGEQSATPASGGAAGAGPGGAVFSSGGAGTGGSSAAGAPRLASPPLSVPVTAADAGAAVPTPPEPSVVNPFTLVAHDPLSTFAADVDTASYDQFLAVAQSGGLPAPSTVRLEEFVNYFSYDYPVPAADASDPFAISLAAAPSIFADGTMTLRVGIQGKAAPAFEKKPANLVYLIDVSGSMQEPSKLPLAQYTVLRSLDVLAPTDVVSVVTYAGFVGVALPPTPVSNRAAITAAVNSLTSGGGTNGAGGIQLAYAQAEQGFVPGGINHVVLCTDGDFNIGVSSTAELVSLIEEKRKTGITLTALGFGAGLNDPMMEAVSNAGNGIYGVITSEAQASRYVSDRLLSTMTHIAKDMKIQVEFNPARVYAYRLLGYEDRAIADADFRNDVVDAGEVGAGHRVTALYQVVLAGGSIPEVTDGAPLSDGAPYDGPVEVADGDVVRVKVRYKNPGASETDPAFEVAMSLAPGELAESLTVANTDFQWAAGVAALAELLRGSPYASPTGLDAIAGVFTQRAGTDPDRVALRDAFAKIRPLLEP